MVAGSTTRVTSIQFRAAWTSRVSRMFEDGRPFDWGRFPSQMPTLASVAQNTGRYLQTKTIHIIGEPYMRTSK